MDIKDSFSPLDNSNTFVVRRAVERLRDGLFDPYAVGLLTAGEAGLNTAFDKGALAISRSESTHLCVCGSYGQGKSHSLAYLRERALDQGFVTSQINLDPREIPFHDFRQVYRALISQIRFPDSDASLAQYWKNWVSQQEILKENSAGLPEIIPDFMPHFFKSVLTALAHKNISLSAKQRALKKHITYRPREFPWLLANGLRGENLPVYRLRHALKYRQVAFYKDASLVCKGWEPYFQALCSLAEMFQKMGFKGWALFFDEGESIGQRPVNIRRKSYMILDRFFSSTAPSLGVYPIFAFTDDFFLQVQGEDYDRLETRGGEERPYFEKDYGKAWHELHVHRLHDLSATDWKNLTVNLIYLHARAYNWAVSEKVVAGKMEEIMTSAGNQEARYRIKALIDELDLGQQEIILGKRKSNTACKELE
jgi:hypothetical protein